MFLSTFVNITGFSFFLHDNCLVLQIQPRVTMSKLPLQAMRQPGHSSAESLQCLSSPQSGCRWSLLPLYLQSPPWRGFYDTRQQRALHALLISLPPLPGFRFLFPQHLTPSDSLSGKRFPMPACFNAISYFCFIEEESGFELR